MKKFTSILLVVVSCFILSGCVSAGATENTIVTLGSSVHFSETDLQAAADAVKEKFKDFKDCELTELWYDEVAALTQSDGNLEKIILFSNFKTGPNVEQTMNADSVYKNYIWFVAKDGTTGEWYVVSWGY
ncbi:hypothetical protein [Culicoidibacter larvae]|uniref:DUF4829 domain-containing protein n=1 Tax=Culicoidibacter larvae TaxID=2579976 RepID=A0A5R8QDN9_9FIRM|nr:hypothetical protein [Culicoidibacter larvae]TLG75385.1 hypothetical protein FEZ08_04875 [Culicoidibacter larvae]